MTTDTVLVPRRTVAPARGLGGILAMELRTWFPWRWMVLSVAEAGVFALVYLPWTLSESNQLGHLLYIFYGLWLAVLALSVVSLTEGLVLGEIESGTAAWLAAMPITRPAIILGKYLAAVAGICAVVFTVGFGVYPLLVSASKRGIGEFGFNELTETLSAPIFMWGRFANLAGPADWAAILLATVLLLSFLAAVMMLLGTLLNSRTLVFGLGLLTIAVFGGLALAGSSGAVSPAGLVVVIVDGLQDKPMELAPPAIATTAYIFVVVVLAMWRFSRRELP